MPFDQKSVPQRLISAARNRTLVPFIGAGVSQQAGDAFPNWRSLLHQMRDAAVAADDLRPEDSDEITHLLERGQFLMAAEALRYSLPPDEYESILRRSFNPEGVGPAEIHRTLFRLNPPLILTTNYDRLLEDAYAEEYRRTPSVVTHRDAAVVQSLLQARRTSDRPLIFKIHGSIDQVGTIILSERDYRELLYRNQGYRLVLSAIFLTHVVLFLGFSFTDPELRLLLEAHREALKHRNDPDFILLPEDAVRRVERRRLREDFGVQVIPYAVSGGHPELLEFVQFLVDASGQAKPAETALSEG